MVDDATSQLADPAYVKLQYSDDERLRIRIATHERCSENTTSFVEWVLQRVGARPGERLLDVGSGPGGYHGRLSGVRVVALDLSEGMLAKLRVPAVRADAGKLPVRDASFDRVMANHVLYHLPDIAESLREIRRVVRPGGRVVLATNSRETMRPLWALTDRISEEVGVPAYRTVALRFGLEDLPVVQEIFPKARVEVYEDAFLFRNEEPLLAYIASMWVDLGTVDQRAQFLARLGDEVRKIIAREGVFRVPKRSGCFVIGC